jgi:hypothetical protein
VRNGNSLLSDIINVEFLALYISVDSVDYFNERIYGDLETEILYEFSERTYQSMFIMLEI